MIEFNSRLLAGAADLSVGQVVDSIHRLEGLAIASHVDRDAFGIIGQLGFIPEELPLDALELSRLTPLDQAGRRFPEYSGRAFIRSSDAHFTDDIGMAPTWFLLDGATVSEIRKAFCGADGRQVFTWGGTQA